MGKSSHRKVGRQHNRIVIIGSGNVAVNIALALKDKHQIVQIYSRNICNAHRLAQMVGATEETDDINKIINDADFYIVSVCDDAIKEVLTSFPVVSGTIVHTSGTKGLEVFNSLSYASTGVLYPLQTFSINSRPDFDEIPILIEGCDKLTTQKIKDFAKTISEKVLETNSEIRRHIHIAAVFANNFVNHIWTLADNYLKQHTDFDISIFEPLLKETLNKVFITGAFNSQTGPAVRNDIKTIQKHLDMLEGKQYDIYKLLTDSIINEHSKENNIYGQPDFKENNTCLQLAQTQTAPFGSR